MSTSEGKEGQEEGKSNEKQVDYIEIPVTDVGAAKRFYGEVFGWPFEDWGPNYASFHDGRLAGGFRQVEVGETVRPGGPLVVIYAADLPDMEARVQRAGGAVVKPTFEFPGGKRFHFTDPAGHELAVWSDR
jgi:predicted enzyme related to lactoylglutathione lyase